MDYESILIEVVALIQDTGRSVTFERLSATPADAAKPWKGAAAPTVASSLTTAATFVPPTGADFGRSFVSEELLARCEQVCLVPANASFDFGTCTSVTDGAKRWNVDWAQELKPGNVSLLFALGVKR